MLRPSSFPYPSVPLRNLPYHALSGTALSSADGGVLNVGQIVWTGDLRSLSPATRNIVVFVEGLGEVVVDPHFLAQVAPSSPDNSPFTINAAPGPARASTNLPALR